MWPASGTLTNARVPAVSSWNDSGWPESGNLAKHFPGHRVDDAQRAASMAHVEPVARPVVAHVVSVRRESDGLRDLQRGAVDDLQIAGRAVRDRNGPLLRDDLKALRFANPSEARSRVPEATLTTSTEPYPSAATNGRS